MAALSQIWGKQMTSTELLPELLLPLSPETTQTKTPVIIPNLCVVELPTSTGFDADNGPSTGD